MKHLSFCILFLFALGTAHARPKEADLNNRLAQEAKRLHRQQINAPEEARPQADAATRRLYLKLARMVGAKNWDFHSIGAAGLKGLVNAAHDRGLFGDMYPFGSTDAKRERVDAVSTANMIVLMQIARKLVTKKGRDTKYTAEIMEAKAFTSDSRVLYEKMRVNLAIGDQRQARWNAVRVLSDHKDLAAVAVYGTSKPKNVRLSAADANRFTHALQVARRGGSGLKDGFKLLVKAESYHDGKSAVPKLQVLGLLASQSRSKASKTLLRELKKWEPVAKKRLVPRQGDRWVAVKGDVSRRQFGHLRAAPRPRVRRQ